MPSRTMFLLTGVQSSIETKQNVPLYAARTCNTGNFSRILHRKTQTSTHTKKMKKKKASNKPLKGISLLALLAIGALLMQQYVLLPSDIAIPNENETTTQTGQDGKTTLAPRLEIPIFLQERKEIRIRHTGYTVSYNNEYKTPHWVAWELTRQETQGTEERKNKFMPDPQLPEPRAEHADYTHSGYDRGHMAPAADMKWNAQAMEESFYMSNICPQNQKLNRDDWGDLEETCRGWARKYGMIYIACGPIYDTFHPKRIGKHRIAVPDRFFKVVLIYNRKSPIAMGFLFNNKAHHQALQKYMVSVDSIETITGMDFFSRLPDDVEQRIESIIPSLPSTR